MGGDYRDSDADDNKAHILGRTGETILKVDKVYGKNGTPLALIFPAAAVRVILHDSTLFRPDEVEQWSEPIETPRNCDAYRWILQIAREKGLAYKAWNPYAEPLDISEDYLDDCESFKWARMTIFGSRYLDDEDELNGSIR
jgi:hypothetical protein